MPQLIENDLITNTSNNFVLSWKDQVKNGNVKIIEPKVSIQKEDVIILILF
jgi:hypothetical protein